MNKISFIIPGRNNKKYLEWAYRAIRLNLETQHEICFNRWNLGMVSGNNER